MASIPDQDTMEVTTMKALIVDTLVATPQDQVDHQTAEDQNVDQDTMEAIAMVASAVAVTVVVSIMDSIVAQVMDSVLDQETMKVTATVA